MSWPQPTKVNFQARLTQQAGQLAGAQPAQMKRGWGRRVLRNIEAHVSGGAPLTEESLFALQANAEIQSRLAESLQNKQDMEVSKLSQQAAAIAAGTSYQSRRTEWDQGRDETRFFRTEYMNEPPERAARRIMGDDVASDIVTSITGYLHGLAQAGDLVGVPPDRPRSQDHLDATIAAVYAQQQQQQLQVDVSPEQLRRSLEAVAAMRPRMTAAERDAIVPFPGPTADQVPTPAPPQPVPFSEPVTAGRPPRRIIRKVRQDG